MTTGNFPGAYVLTLVPRGDAGQGLRRHRVYVLRNKIERHVQSI